MSSVQWDYSALAEHYDKRADYADEAIDTMLEITKPGRARPIADIGAGTGKLTKMLIARGYEVWAVEPNDAMRIRGIKNTADALVRWTIGTGEQTGLPDASCDLVAFGSSFNVTDRPKTLKEVARIARSHGWFACMWNHRDIDDDVQRLCEKIIRDRIPEFDYGSRREDQTGVIRASGLFEEPLLIESQVVHEMSLQDFVGAWRSHATLQRQAGAVFETIVREIEDALSKWSTLHVPYTTRLWCARLKR